MSLTTESKREVQRLIRAGKKIEAIKLLTEELDISLLQARQLVDTAEKEMDLSADTPLTSNNNFSSGLQDLSHEIKDLLQARKKIEAVKLVKHRQNISFKEALAQVEAVEVLTNPDSKSTAFINSRKNPFSLFGKLFAGIGVLLVCISLFIFYLKQQTIGKSELGEGFVTDLIQSRDTYAPVIEYSWRGRTFVYESSVYSKPSAYDVGEQVQIFINRQDPKDIVVNTFTGRWLAIIIVAGIGTFFFAFGLLFIFVAGKF